MTQTSTVAPTTADYLNWLYSAPTVAERNARTIAEHEFSNAHTIARFNAGLITHAVAVARIADTLTECEGLDDATATATAVRYIANNPQL